MGIYGHVHTHHKSFPYWKLGHLRNSWQNWENEETEAILFKVVKNLTPKRMFWGNTWPWKEQGTLNWRSGHGPWIHHSFSVCAIIGKLPVCFRVFIYKTEMVICKLPNLQGCSEAQKILGDAYKCILYGTEWLTMENVKIIACSFKRKS